MEPTKGTGAKDPGTTKSTDTQTDASPSDKSLAAAGADRRPSGTETDGGMLTGGRDAVDATDITQFQLDVLAILAGDGTADQADYGLAIKRALEGYYGEEVNHGRLYPNLDDLVDRGLVVKDALDDRTNTYALTDAGRGVLDARINWLLDQTATTDDEPAPIAGEGGAAGGVE